MTDTGRIPTRKELDERIAALRAEVAKVALQVSKVADGLAEREKPSVPTPPSRIGQWLVDAAYPTHWYGPVMRQDEDGDWEGEQCYCGHEWRIQEEWIDNGTFLRIPPMPAEQPGVVWRECRLPKRGEQYSLEGSSILVTAYSDWVATSSDDFDGRRWIASPVPAAKPVEAPAPAPAPARIALPVRVEKCTTLRYAQLYCAKGKLVAQGMTNAEAAEIASALNERAAVHGADGGVGENTNGKCRGRNQAGLEDNPPRPERGERREGMSVRIIIHSENDNYWCAAERTDVELDNEATAFSASCSTKKAALRDMIRFCESAIRAARKELEKKA